MEFTIPVVDVEIDTDDYGESAQNALGGVAGIAGLATISAAGIFLFNRGKSVLGIENDNIPGV